MRTPLLIACLLALLGASSAQGYEAGAITTITATSQRSDRVKKQRAADIAAINAYCAEAQERFKHNPQLTRYFVDASPEGKEGWHELKNSDETLEAEHSYANRSVAVSMSPSGELVYAEVGEPMEHSRHSNHYCFRVDGTLAKVVSGYDSNMAEMSVQREIFYDSKVNPLRTTFQCFKVNSANSKRTSVSCQRPEMSEEIRSYEIKVYKRNSELPVYGLLKKP
jgi:hypothetical protein